MDQITELKLENAKLLREQGDPEELKKIQSQMKKLKKYE